MTGLGFKAPSPHEVPQRVIDRVWENVAIGDPSECWLWQLSTASHGYGQVGWWSDGRTAGTTAHRVAWISENGPIPQGVTVDHLCRNRRCCNPTHLRLLSNVANAADNGQGRKTHCPHGHPYDEANTHVDRRGHRKCRTCARGRAF